MVIHTKSDLRRGILDSWTVYPDQGQPYAEYREEIKNYIWAQTYNLRPVTFSLIQFNAVFNDYLEERPEIFFNIWMTKRMSLAYYFNDFLREF